MVALSREKAVSIKPNTGDNTNESIKAAKKPISLLVPATPIVMLKASHTGISIISILIDSLRSCGWKVSCGISKKIGREPLRVFLLVEGASNTVQNRKQHKEHTHGCALSAVSLCCIEFGRFSTKETVATQLYLMPYLSL
jgi:hypothetical protein